MGSKVVVFDIVSRDLQVAYFRAFDANAALPVIAYMATCYIDLMEVHAIEINTHSGIEIKVAMGNHYVAVSVDQVNPMTATRDHHALENGLHGLDQFKTIGFRMGTFHLYVLDRGHALVSLYVSLPACGITRASMRTDQAKSGALACHHHTGRATRTINTQGTTFRQIDLDRRSNAIGPGRKMQDTIALGDRMPDRLRIIGLPVSNGAKSNQVTHRAKKPSSGAVDALLSLPFAENEFKEQGQRETVIFP
jgi:hypothetical protein